MNIEQDFTQFKLNKQLLNAVADAGFKNPTAIQRGTIVPMLAGQEVIGIAQTGTGKTAAYLLPLIKMLGYAQGIHPRALIIIPTRELAQQVAAHFTLFSKYTDLRYTVAIGAMGSKNQIEAIAAGIDVIIATPGRLLELYSNGHLVLKKIEYFVLDEAERLMDISFMRQLYALLEVLPRKRKHYLFSATMSDLVKKIAADFVAFPTVIEIEPEHKTAKSVSQQAYSVPNLKTKINLLSHLLKQKSADGLIIKKLIVFCRSKETANNLFKYFTRINGDGYATVIHGNKTQQSRLNAVKNFSNQAIPMLIATDVAARGIDVADVTHVVNFDLPLVIEDYIHRIGRTGRAFNVGHAISMVTDADGYYWNQIEKRIGNTIELNKLPDEVTAEATPFDEHQTMQREIDRQKRKNDPNFKGAFHQKKQAKKATKKPMKKSVRFDKPRKLKGQ